MPFYVYRPSPDLPIQPYDQLAHGDPSEYLGGDSGPEMVRKDYMWCDQQGPLAIFLNLSNRSYHVAVQVGETVSVSGWPTFEQEQADMLVPEQITLRQGVEDEEGPFLFFDLLYALEAGPVTPREAIAAGYFGEDCRSLRGRVCPLPFSSFDEAQAQAQALRAHVKEISPDV